MTSAPDRRKIAGFVDEAMAAGACRSAACGELGLHPQTLARWPGSVDSSAAGTPSRAAAASISMARASAPTRRMVSMLIRIDIEPPVSRSPLLSTLYWSSAGAFSTVNRAGSRSSSSPTIWIMPVKMPCPPSTKGLISRAVPSGRISRKAGMRVPGAAEPSARAAPAGRPKPRTSAPEATPAADRKPRREMLTGAPDGKRSSAVTARPPRCPPPRSRRP